MLHATRKRELPTSFGSFKPVGHLLLGLPDDATLERVREALQREGFAGDDVVQFTPRESAEEMARMIDGASPIAGFGYEITLMRRYLKLARDGYRWLLVHCESEERARFVAELAQPLGAGAAVHYRRLVEEEFY